MHVVVDRVVSVSGERPRPAPAPCRSRRIERAPEVVLTHDLGTVGPGSRTRGSEGRAESAERIVCEGGGRPAGALRPLAPRASHAAAVASRPPPRPPHATRPHAHRTPSASVRPHTPRTAPPHTPILSPTIYYFDLYFMYRARTPGGKRFICWVTRAVRVKLTRG